MEKLKILALVSFLLAINIISGNGLLAKPRVLVFSKTLGFHHNSIAAGILAIQKLGKENNFDVDTTTNADHFNPKKLKKYKTIIFLSTTGNVLNPAQQESFEHYIQKGGGFVGIHAATDCEYEWPWYNKLVGAYFNGHPAPQQANLNVINHNHPSTNMLPDVWKRKDEWYNFKAFNPDVKVLVTIDETTYDAGKTKMGDPHPISWYHSFDGGRAFYTGLGHTDESFQESAFLAHLLGGINYAMGKKK